MFDTRIKMANVLISIKTDMPLFVEKRIEDFICDEDNIPDVLVTIKEITDTEVDNLKKICETQYELYRSDEHTVFYHNLGKNISLHKMYRKGKNAKLFVIEENGVFNIFADKIFSEMFETEGKYIQFLDLEKLLLKFEAFYLHSSLIKIEDKAFLFSGPSGIGKSTQANLWEKHRSAKILNGDRSIIRKIDNDFYAFGSPFAGSSNIFINDNAKISGIIFLQQGKENNLKPLKEKEAFMKLYGQSMLSGIPKEYLEIGTDLLADMSSKIPIYEYTCTPTEAAVEYLEKEIL